MPQDEEPAQPVPEGWEKRTSRSTGMVYYLNVHTKGESLLNFHKACEFYPEHFQNHNGKHPQRKPSHRASFRRSRHHIFLSSTPVLADLRAGVRIPSHGRRKRLELFSKVTCRRSKRFVGFARFTQDQPNLFLTFQGAEFAELASKYSDCSSYKKGGDLGKFKVRSSSFRFLS